MSLIFNKLEANKDLNPRFAIFYVGSCQLENASSNWSRSNGSEFAFNDTLKSNTTSVCDNSRTHRKKVTVVWFLFDLK
jgi:hypothetical protein